MYNRWLRGELCYPCLAGTYSGQAGASACTACSAGTYSSKTGLNSSSLCKLCLRGYYSTIVGQTSAGQCVKCPVGRTSDAGASACVPCRPGEFPNDLYGGCASCPVHSVNITGPFSPEDCACLPGYRMGYNAKALGGSESYTNGLTKTHTYQASPSPDDQLAVFADTLAEVYCNGQLLARIALVQGSYPANPGGACVPPIVFQYGVDVQFDGEVTQTYKQCMPCEKGSYSANGGACLPCPPQTFQNSTAQSTCLACPTGNVVVSGATSCSACQPGTTFRDGACRPCPDGQFYPLYLGGQCLPCPVGMWSNQASGGCRLCPEFSSGPGGTDLTGCKCVAGRALQAVQNTPYCVLCQAGKYAGTGTDQCLPCPNGTFAGGIGSSACAPCPARNVAAGGASACVPCRPGELVGRDLGSCVPCPAGSYCELDQVISCPLGTYSLRTGLTSASQCPLCPKNFACVSPLRIEACPAHTTSPAGSVNKHKCVCDRGYRCDYSFSTKGAVSLSLSRDEFEASRDALIQALASEAGVDPSKVQIVGVNR